jgi:glycosyltransferase involved in cell wall biosynthesis
MHIVMFTRFSEMGANSRYRLLQYIPLLQQAGHQVQVRPMLDDAYLKVMYSSRRRSLWHTVRGYARRISQLRDLATADVILCDQEFLPYFPVFAETSIATRCRRLIVDYDDAAYFKYQHIPGLRNRIPALMAAAEAVAVGNRALADYASTHNPRVHVIPTVVDPTRYAPKQDYAAPAGVRLVWIGTPVTANFLRPIVPALTEVRHNYPDLRLRLIGAGDALCSELPFAEVVAWSEDSESNLLAECDIGLMPLPDNDFTRGKCGLKLIQYMAAGLPVVASPVGANLDIVSEGLDGFLPGEHGEWVAALRQLIENDDQRRLFGRRGVEKVAQQYSIQKGFECWMSLLDPHFQSGTRNVRNTATAVRT